MIDILLHVTLGFLAASCLALLGGRLLWSRAVRLTARRLEGQLPSSLGEIVAAQDMIRAEAAIRTRALERAVSSLRSKLVIAEAAAASSDTERTRYALHHNEKTATALALETRIKSLEEQLNDARGLTREASDSRDQARDDFAALRKKLDADNRALAEARVELDAQKVRLVAMDVETSNMRDDRDDNRKELTRTASQLKDTETRLQQALAKCDELSTKLIDTAASDGETLTRFTALREQHDHQTAELERIRKTLAETNARAEVLRSELAERESRIASADQSRAELEARLHETETALRSTDERTTKDAKRADLLAKEMESFASAKAALEKRVRRAEDERDAMAKALPAAAKAQATAEKLADRQKARSEKLAEDLQALQTSLTSRNASYAEETKRLEAALSQMTAEHTKAQAAEASAVERVRILSQELLAARGGPDSGHATLENELAKVRAEKTNLEVQLTNARAEWAKVERQIKRSVEGGPAGRADNNLLRARLDMLADEIALFAGTELPPANGADTPSVQGPALMHALSSNGEARTRDTAGAAG